MVPAQARGKAMAGKGPAAADVIGLYDCATREAVDQAAGEAAAAGALGAALGDSALVVAGEAAVAADQAAGKADLGNHSAREAANAAVGEVAAGQEAARDIPTALPPLLKPWPMCAHHGQAYSCMPLPPVPTGGPGSGEALPSKSPRGHRRPVGRWEGCLMAQESAGFCAAAGRHGWQLCAISSPLLASLHPSAWALLGTRLGLDAGAGFRALDRSPVPACILPLSPLLILSVSLSFFFSAPSLPFSFSVRFRLRACTRLDCLHTPVSRAYLYHVHTPVSRAYLYHVHNRISCTPVSRAYLQTYSCMYIAAYVNTQMHTCTLEYVHC